MALVTSNTFLIGACLGNDHNPADMGSLRKRAHHLSTVSAPPPLSTSISPCSLIIGSIHCSLSSMEGDHAKLQLGKVHFGLGEFQLEVAQFAAAADEFSAYTSILRSLLYPLI